MWFGSGIAVTIAALPGAALGILRIEACEALTRLPFQGLWNTPAFSHEKDVGLFTTHGYAHPRLV